MTIQHDAAQERGEALREAWEAQFDARHVAECVGDLLADYLTDNFPQLRPWQTALYPKLARTLSAMLEDSLPKDEQLATLGEVFGEAVSWETYQKQQPAQADPFHSDDPRVQ